MTEEEKLKASLALLKADADIEFERAKRNADIIGIIGLITLIGCSLFLAAGAVILILLARG
jgi:hypothetical protein